MAKHRKPSIADGISFVFELYKRIPIRRKITASELQVQLKEINLERDIRTIQRNLDVLAHYFDVEKDTRDKPHGYSRRSNNEQTRTVTTKHNGHIKYTLHAHSEVAM